MPSRTVPASEHLKAIPEQLETLLSEKRLLLAALVLVRSVKTLNKPALSEIGALADLRNYFSLQEVVRTALALPRPVKAFS